MKTALIGLGRMGMRHADAISSCDLVLTSIADINAKTCKIAGNELGITSAFRFTDPEDMIRKIRPELLIIATTAPSHYPLVLEAVKSGTKAILCEKPMGTSLGECEEMVALCEEAGVRLAVNHQMRFMDQYIKPKQMAATDAFGGLSGVIVSAGNFGVSMNGTHYFEMFRFLTDEPTVKVSAWFAKDVLPNPRGPEFEDVAGCVRLETVSGKRFYLDCSPDQGHGVQVTYNCRYGRISVDELSGELRYSVRTEEHRDAPTTRYGMPSEVGVELITPADATVPTASVLKALVEGGDYPSGLDGAMAFRILIAAHISNSRGGAEIDLRTEVMPRQLRLPVA